MREVCSSDNSGPAISPTPRNRHNDAKHLLLAASPRGGLKKLTGCSAPEEFADDPHEPLGSRTDAACALLFAWIRFYLIRSLRDRNEFAKFVRFGRLNCGKQDRSEGGHSVRPREPPSGHFDQKPCPQCAKDFRKGMSAPTLRYPGILETVALIGLNHIWKKPHFLW